MRKFIKFRSLRGFMLAEPIVILVATATLVVAPILTPRSQGAVTTCVSNQKQISTATMMYIQENDECLPSTNDNVWYLIDVGGKMLKCPSDKNRAENAYAFNASMSDIYLGEINDPNEIALTADSENENNLMTGFDDIIKRHRGDCAVISFVDSHVIATDNFNDIRFQ